MAGRRLNLFAKGNVDLRDSLLCSTVGGICQWNGINEIVGKAFPGRVVRVRHETMTRSDALAATSGSVPPELQARNLPLAPYPLDAQFSRKVFETASDVVVLSILPDLNNMLFRHRRLGYVFYPYRQEEWPASEQQWLRDNFERLGLLDVAASIDNLGRVCREIDASVGCPILIYNLCTVVPGEHVHCYQGIGEVLSARIRRLNLGLIELSERLGISVVDVDAIVARAGGERLRVGPVHLTAEGYRLVAAEVVRVLHDLGCFD